MKENAAAGVALDVVAVAPMLKALRLGRLGKGATVADEVAALERIKLNGLKNQSLNQKINAKARIANRVATKEEWALYSSQSRSAGNSIDHLYPNAAENRATYFNSNEWPQYPGTVSLVEGDFTLLPGSLIDRFGPPRGAFLSPEGTSYSARALKPGTMRDDFYVYEVLQPLTVKAGEVKPWFGEVGNGVQFRLDSIDGIRRSPSTLTNGDNQILKEVYRGKYWDYKNP